MTSDSRRRLWRAVVVVAFVALASRPGAVLSAVHEISIISFAFEPATLEIEQGDTVRWTVKSGRHSSTADQNNWDSGVMRAGESFELRFDDPGTFSFHCTPHSFMQANIIVRKADTIDRSLMLWGLAILGLAVVAVTAGWLVRRKQR